MPLEDVCVHRCTPISTIQPDGDLGDAADGVWIEGEWYPVDDGGSGGPSADPRRGTPFDGCLFLPRGDETPGGTGVVVLSGRQVRRPTLLYLPENDLGDAVALDPKDRVGIVAEEINVAEGRPAGAEVEWIVDGAPQPFGKPGEDVIGFLAGLTKVEGE